jgi:hypothetical protein
VALESPVSEGPAYRAVVLYGGVHSGDGTTTWQELIGGVVMAWDNAADFVAAHPDWATVLVHAGAPGTAVAMLLALAGPTTLAGTRRVVWSRTDGHPWFVPIPPV